MTESVALSDLLLNGERDCKAERGVGDRGHCALIQAVAFGEPILK